MIEADKYKQLGDKRASEGRVSGAVYGGISNTLAISSKVYYVVHSETIEWFVFCC